MMQVLEAASRGQTQIDWLDSRHTFSFGGYRDPNRMGVGPLRVINDDRVIAGAGFGTHGHADMEILTYVVAGGLAHRDSTGVSSVIRPGELQRMRAGTGIRHSEFNASKTEPVHFYQIWIVPDTRGLNPGYAQQAYPLDEERLHRVASRDGQDGSLQIMQDVDVFAARLQTGAPQVLDLRPGRVAFVQVVGGAPMVNGVARAMGDGVILRGEPHLVVQGRGAEVLVFDLPRG